MKVCQKEHKKKEFITGNIYQTKSNNYFFMYTGNNKGVCLNTGYNPVEMTDISFWEDVTHKVCLMEI